MSSIKSPRTDGIHPRVPEELKYEINKLLIMLSNLLPVTECPLEKWDINLKKKKSKNKKKSSINNYNKCMEKWQIMERTKHLLFMRNCASKVY